MNDSRLEVVEEESGGYNKKFKDTQTGEIVSVQQVADNIKNYPGYHVAKRDGKLFIRSNPDDTKDNNLK